MVIDNSVKVYACPYCSNHYPNRGDAEECRTECLTLDMEEIIEDIKEKYTCEMCGKDHQEEILAEKCEARHKEDNDKHYKIYLDKVEKMKLQQAARHPEQIKLIEV